MTNELSSEALGLIAKARLADGPSPERRARVKQALAASLLGASVGLGTQASAAALGSVAAGKSALSLGSVALWLGAGAVLGTLVAVPATVGSVWLSEPRAVPTADALASPRTPLEAEPAPAVEPALAPTAATTLPTKNPGGPYRTDAATAGAGATSPPDAGIDAGTSAPAPRLAAETRLIEAAQSELARGRARSALGLLDEHAQQYPAGALVEERIAVRVLALCALGRVSEAERTATAFVAAAPRSPLLPRLRGSCALEGKADDAMPAR